MKLKDVIQALMNPDCACDTFTLEEFLDREVVFNTYCRHQLELLSVYWHEGHIEVDVGDEDDA